jgi:hypothetical protein
MAVVVVFQGPSFTRQNYEESVRRVTGGRARVETPADWPGLQTPFVSSERN